LQSRPAGPDLRLLGRGGPILAPPAGVRSEFRPRQVRLLDIKISSGVPIAARSYKNRKGHVRKSTGAIEPSTICRQAGSSERAPERVVGTKTVRSFAARRDRPCLACACADRVPDLVKGMFDP